MSRQRINLGKTGEKIAESFLIQKGLKILIKNYRNKFGEIDIVALDGDIVVFIEVKTRSNHHFGSPEEAVTHTKQKQICRAAKGYLLFYKLFESPIRFDVVAVTLKSDGPLINHIIAAFDAP